MNLFPKIHWKTLFIAPVVVAGVLAALWLTVTSAFENYRFARATGQILSVVAVARDMKVPLAATPVQSTADLFDRLLHIDDTRVQTAAGGGKTTLANPWGGSVDLEMQPAQRQLRVLAAVSPVICRRLVQFYAKDAGPLGLQHVEVRDEGFAGMAPRLLYDAGNAPSQASLSAGSIARGCGSYEQVVLALTFRLQ
ncbi:MAG: hypothetical protein PHY92_09890 [Alphaproteobacteria bacterium]|nr:hypothetical protein [Alphaproteobacteria bacterium]